MPNERVTNKDLSIAINDLRKEIKEDVNELKEKVNSNTAWRNQLTGKITVIVIIIGVAINWIWDLFFNGKK